MQESSGIIFCYLSPTLTRSPSGTKSPDGTGITLRCNPGSPSLSRHPTCVGTLVEIGILVRVGVLVQLGVLK